jgi:hypothetical protein
LGLYANDITIEEFHIRGRDHISKQEAREILRYWAFSFNGLILEMLKGFMSSNLILPKSHLRWLQYLP